MHRRYGEVLLNAAKALIDWLWNGQPLARPVPAPDIAVLSLGWGKPKLRLERVACPDPCAGCSDAACPHHGPFVRKLQRRAARAKLRGR